MASIFQEINGNTTTTPSSLIPPTSTSSIINSIGIRTALILTSTSVLFFASEKVMAQSRRVENPRLENFRLGCAEAIGSVEGLPLPFQGSATQTSPAQTSPAQVLPFQSPATVSVKAAAKAAANATANTHVVAPKPPTEVRDLRTFGQAMTEGMLLRPEQSDLFEIYRRVFFGDPSISVDSTLKTVTDILKEHPELEKPHFREYEIETVQKVYETPESLTKYLKSQNMSAGQVRSNLFQVEANLGFWKKMMGYQDPPMPANLSKANIQRFKEQVQVRLMRYLDRIISKANRALLIDEKVEYGPKIKTLFHVLKRMSEHLERRGRDNRAVRQAMVDLVATTGFNNQSTQALLKSKNALNRIEGLKKIADERDSMAMELGYVGHFKELMGAVKIDSPSMSIKPMDELKMLSHLEGEVLTSPFKVQHREISRVRSLSIQESPFRSCLGGSDCSSRTYFSKALDPNYNYFTMTDGENHSSGHVTIVLGTAKDGRGHELKVAFVDKLQNVPNQRIKPFLEAVRLAIGEKGYVLGVPEDVGDHNGLSNMDTIRHFVAKDIVPQLSMQVTEFEPHPNAYGFKNAYSRAYGKPKLRIFEFKLKGSDIEIRKGQSYEPRLADASLSSRKLVQELIDLRESSQATEVQKYIASGLLIPPLEKLGLFTRREFLEDLTRIANDHHQVFTTRKQALFELLLQEGDQISQQGGDQGAQTERAAQTEKELDGVYQLLQSNTFTNTLTETERTQITSELKQWSKSSDKRRKGFADQWNELWFRAVRTGKIKLFEVLRVLRLVDIDQKNPQGDTALHVAVQNYQVGIFDHLLADPRFNGHALDSKGFTALDHAMALGHQDLVKHIMERRPDLQRTDKVKARPENNVSVHQSMNFIKIAGGSFMMGDQKVPTTLTKPFEIMDTLMTQKTYLLLTGENPSNFKEGPATAVMRVGGELHTLQPDNPVENVSYEDGERLLKKINELSQSGDPLLEQLIKGHKKGDHYDFITEAQLEYVMKKAQTEDGDTIDNMLARADYDKLHQYALLGTNSNRTSHSVTQKKPLYVDGQPIHDINGHLWVWVKDWYDNNLSGGLDPEGPRRGSVRVMRGGSWINVAQALGSAFRSSGGPDVRSYVVGFRLVRTAK